MKFILKTNTKQILKVTKGEFPILNVGTGQNIYIKKLAELIKNKINYKGKINFNSKYPDGTMKKNLDSSKIRKLGWKPKTDLQKGIEKVIKYKLETM